MTVQEGKFEYGKILHLMVVYPDSQVRSNVQYKVNITII